MSLFYTKKRFFAAAAGGDSMVIRDYIANRRIPISEVDDKKSKNTALHLAAANGRTEVVRLLLAAGASTYAGNKDNDLPLTLAVRGGHAETVRVMIELPCPYINTHSSSQRSPMQAAIADNRLDILKMFLESGKVDLTADDPPALYAAVLHRQPDCVRLLLAAGADPNTPRKQVHRAYNDFMDYHYGRLEKDTITYHSPLQRACDSGSRDIALILLKAGAKPVSGEYPVHAAAAAGDVVLVEALAAAGLPLAGRNDALQTPLHAAAAKNQADMVRFLLANGADKSLLDKQSRTALSYAQQFAFTETVDALQGTKLAQALKTADALPSPKAPSPTDNPLPPPLPETATAEAPKDDAKGGETWTRDGHSVIHLREFTGLGRRLTEIFNFETRERVVISENLALKSETMGPHEGFAAVSEGALEKALAEFRRLGGTAQDSDVFPNRLAKLKPAGG
jgi:ankyrin repeat protein